MCLYKEKGKQGVTQCYLPVESFIRAESAPGGLMWSHGATANTEWIQRCNQAYFLSLKLPAQTALLHLEIHPPQYNTIFVMIVQLQFHMRNFTKYSSAIFVSWCRSLFKRFLFFFHFYFERKSFNFHFQPWYYPALPQWMLGSHCPFLFVLFIVRPRCPLKTNLRNSLTNVRHADIHKWDATYKNSVCEIHVCEW